MLGQIVPMPNTMHRVRNFSLALLIPAVTLAIWAGCETNRSDVPALPALPPTA